AVHTGDTQERDGDYFGPAVNRVARLLAIGHGGQVLVSGVAAELAQSALPSQVVLRDLGTHRLRDLTHPEQVFQLKAPDLPSEFPPLRSLDALPNNLPLQLTSFIGRDAELSEMKQLLEKTRLLTLFGAGGVGKTRAAIQLGADLLDVYPDGVWFADLAPISDGALVPSELASGLGLQGSSEKLSANIVVAMLKNSHALVILDSCEHVIAAVAGFANALLRGCPKLKIVVTSREALGISGESVHRMPSMECPPAGKELSVEQAMEYGAVALFVERAHAADNKFALTNDTVPIVADICRRLDGIALAIELAAPRVKVLNLKQLAERLNERFRILTSGSRTALPRQQTMRALIDWSYNLLPPKEQQLFRMLSIFAGGWTLEAASAVCAVDDIEEFEVLDELSALIDKSLAQVEFTEASQRYKLLESMRHYGLEKLQQSGERAASERRRAEYFADFVARIAQAFNTTPTYALLTKMEPEFDNIRAALEWALVERSDIELGQRLAADLGCCLQAGLRAPEMQHWLRLAMDTTDSTTPQEVVAKLWFGVSWVNVNLLAYFAAADAAKKAMEIYERLGDELGAMRSAVSLGRSLSFTGRYPEGKAWLERALTVLRKRNLPKLLGDCLESLGTGACIANDIQAARDYYREALPMVQAAGDDRKVSVVLSNKAETEFQAGAIEAALDFNAQGLALDRARKNLISAAGGLSNRAAYLIAGGQISEALVCAREALQIQHEAQLAALAAAAVQHFAAIATERGDAQRGARLLGFVEARLIALELVREYTEQREADAMLAVLRKTLAKAELTRLMDEGRLWSEDRAVAEAFEVS
ncbi:MAG: hypothetical protein M3Z37_09220, partial [Candidatus Eremiobacteraeota bacterium]|nr:hypothetical protein [Candidatus Eremiobacteraeota bacterium]